MLKKALQWKAPYFVYQYFVRDPLFCTIFSSLKLQNKGPHCSLIYFWKTSFRDRIFIKFIINTTGIKKGEIFVTVLEWVKSIWRIYLVSG